LLLLLLLIVITFFTNAISTFHKTVKFFCYYVVGFALTFEPRPVAFALTLEQNQLLLLVRPSAK